jgi:Xaa-Pro aminopeptidase
VADCYAALLAAQQAAVASVGPGVAAEEVDAVARGIIDDAGYGKYFIHRTGHGIGIEEHEDPYLVAGNRTPLATGHAFSIEPGIYLSGRFGMRLEDIVVVGESGPDPLNTADHALVVVDA